MAFLHISVMPEFLTANGAPESLVRVLLPVDVSGPVSPDDTVMQMVQCSEVLLLGYWPIPDQSTAEQHRDQFCTEAEKRLQAIADQFRDHGIDFQKRLEFTKDRGTMIDTAVNKYGCQSVVIQGSEEPTSGTTRGIVLVKPDADLERIVTTLGALFAESDVTLYLFHAAKHENDPYWIQRSICSGDLRPTSPHSGLNPIESSGNNQSRERNLI